MSWSVPRRRAVGGAGAGEGAAGKAEGWSGGEDGFATGDAASTAPGETNVGDDSGTGVVKASFKPVHHR